MVDPSNPLYDAVQRGKDDPDSLRYDGDPNDDTSPSGSGGGGSDGSDRVDDTSDAVTSGSSGSSGSSSSGGSPSISDSQIDDIASRSPLSRDAVEDAAEDYQPGDSVNSILNSVMSDSTQQQKAKKKQQQKKASEQQRAKKKQQQKKASEQQKAKNQQQQPNPMATWLQQAASGMEQSSQTQTASQTGLTQTQMGLGAVLAIGLIYITQQ